MKTFDAILTEKKDGIHISLLSEEAKSYLKKLQNSIIKKESYLNIISLLVSYNFKFKYIHPE